jgi:hypothetical protein
MYILLLGATVPQMHEVAVKGNEMRPKMWERGFYAHPVILSTWASIISKQVKDVDIRKAQLNGLASWAVMGRN